MHIPRELENVLGPGIYLQMKGTNFPATHLSPPTPPTPKDLYSSGGDRDYGPALPTVKPLARVAI